MKMTGEVFSNEDDGIWSRVFEGGVAGGEFLQRRKSNKND
jgi:hypothetical protein